MKRRQESRRRPVIQITLGRASRLHRLVMILGQGPRERIDVLGELGIGLRTFYRELALMKRFGIRIRSRGRPYELLTSPDHAAGLLPFPDPRFSFAEVVQLARCPGAAGQRLAELLAYVTDHGETAKGRPRRHRRTARAM